jgi:hypothetical protein
MKILLINDTNDTTLLIPLGKSGSMTLKMPFTNDTNDTNGISGHFKEQGN